MLHQHRVQKWPRWRGRMSSFLIVFTVGGDSWCIRYYPNSRDRHLADYISLFLALDESVDELVRVQYALRFADVAGEDDAGDAEEREVLESTKLVKDESYDAYGYSRFIRRRALERSRHLRDDAFTVRCDMIVVDFVSDEVSATSVPVLLSNLQEHLKDLREKHNGIDVVFEVGRETVAAHRCMLAVRSPVFNAELFGEMKESSAGVVHDNMEVAVFKALLYFIYTNTLPEMSGEDEYVMSQHLLVVLDRYNLERLKSICEHNLSERIEAGNVMFVLELTEQHHCRGLKNACFEFLSTPVHLEAALATDSFKDMSRNCPFIMMELIAKLGTQLRH